MLTRRGKSSAAMRRTRQGEGPTGAPISAAPPAQALGRFFRRSRQAQELSQEQLADLTRGRPGTVSRAMISAIERGVHMPGVEVLLTLSHALHISPNEVLERLELSRGAETNIARLSDEAAEKKASTAFWAGDYRTAAAHYDALLRRYETETLLDDPVEQRRRIATIEIRRGTALRRCGVNSSARAAIERAIALSDDSPELQSQAYVVLVALLVQAGCLPLARDAADRAVALADGCPPQVQGYAWIEKGEVLAASGQFGEARRAFLEARRQVRLAGDRRHQINVEGNLGHCLHGMGSFRQARLRYLKAVELAQRFKVPAAEALWLLELGRLCFDEDKHDAADGYAQASLQIAKSGELLLTCFRAEWLRHRIVLAHNPTDADRHRLAYLRRLYTRLETHRGIGEVVEFRKAHCSPGKGGSEGRQVKGGKS